MKKITKAITISATVAAVVLTGAFFLKKQPVYNNYDEIQLCSVRRTDLDNSIYIIVSVESNESETLYSHIDAPVDEIMVNKGDLVKAGDVICTFDRTALQKKCDQYEASLKQLQEIDDAYADHFELNASIEESLLAGQIEQLRKKIENYQKQYDEAMAKAEEYCTRYESAAAEEKQLSEMIDSGAGNIGNMEAQLILASGKKNDAAQMQQEILSKAENISDLLESSRRELSSLQIMQSDPSAGREQYFTPDQRSKTIAAYREQIAALKEMLAQSTIIATRDGIITELYVSPDNYLSDLRVCCIQDPDNIHFSGYLLPEDISTVTMDSNIVVNMPDQDHRDVEGKIRYISDRYDERNKGYKVEFTIEDTDKYPLYPGNELSARIVLESQADTLVVPYDAVFENGGKQYVRKYDAAGNAADIQVKVGLSTSYYVAVESPELSENDLVATDMPA